MSLPVWVLGAVELAVMVYKGPDQALVLSGSFFCISQWLLVAVVYFSCIVNWLQLDLVSNTSQAVGWKDQTSDWLGTSSLKLPIMC